MTTRLAGRSPGPCGEVPPRRGLVGRCCRAGVLGAGGACGGASSAGTAGINAVSNLIGGGLMANVCGQIHGATDNYVFALLPRRPDAAECDGDPVRWTQAKAAEGAPAAR